MLDTARVCERMREIFTLSTASTDAPSSTSTRTVSAFPFSLANIKAATGSLDQVARIVFVSGYVNAVDGFSDSPAVINGASDLFVKLFGDAGKHARAAVAVNGLPRGSTTEIQVVVELKN